MMRLIFTICLFPFAVFAQDPGEGVGCERKKEIVVKAAVYMIDGQVSDWKAVSDIEVSNIIEVRLIKGLTDLQCGPGCKGNDTIFITTQQNNWKILVKDADDSALIAGATIMLKPFAKKKPVISAISGNNGIAKFTREGKKYQAEISAVGYKPVNIQLSRDSKSKTITVAMQKQFVQMEPAVVIGYTSIRRRSVTCVCGGVRCTQQIPLDYPKDNVAASSIFPNPLSRGQAATIAINAAKDELMQVRLFTFTGQQLLSFPAQVKQGSNRFTIPANNKLTAGMYLVQVLDHKGKPIQTEKLIIQ